MTGHGVSLKVRTARYGFAQDPLSWLALAVILTGCATPAPQVMHGRSRPPGQYATLVTSITHGLSIDSIDGTPPTGAPVSRQEITPGHHTVKVRAVITEGGRSRATGPVSLSFVARAGHEYLLGWTGDVKAIWLARIDDAGPTRVAKGRPRPPAGELATACDKNRFASCVVLGELYEAGAEEVGQDEERAVELYARACSGGEALGCAHLGLLYKAGTAVNRDECRAADLFDQACAAGEARGCTHLGLLYQEGRIERGDTRSPATLLEQGCNGGDAAGCYNLGLFLREDPRQASDERRIAALYERACDGGDPQGCAGLGLLYEDGLGVEQNESRAAGLYRTACAGGDPAGCANLGVLYQLGLGVARSPQRAMKLFKKACAGGVATACASFARLAPDWPASVEETSPPESPEVGARP